MKGQRVVVLASPFYGVTGTLIRPARLLWKRAWLVELDTAPRRFTVRKTRIVRSALAPVDAADALLGNRRAARSAFARSLFAILAPLVPMAWILLHPLVALMFSGFVLGLLVVGFVRRG